MLLQKKLKNTFLTFSIDNPETDNMKKKKNITAFDIGNPETDQTM